MKDNKKTLFIALIISIVLVVFLGMSTNTNASNNFSLSITATNTTVVVADSGGNPVVAGEDKIIENEIYTLTAIAEENCVIETLTLNGQTVESGCSFSGTTNIVIVANSVGEPYNLIFYNQPHTTITVLRNGVEVQESVAYEEGSTIGYDTGSYVHYGEILTISVTVEDGFHLYGSLSVNNEDFTSGETYVVNGPVNIGASAVSNYFDCTYEYDDTMLYASVGSLERGVVHFGVTYTINVTPKTGYDIDTITYNGEIVQNQYEFVCNGPVNVTATATTKLVSAIFENYLYYPNIYAIYDNDTNLELSKVSDIGDPTFELTFGHTYKLIAPQYMNYIVDYFFVNAYNEENVLTYNSHVDNNGTFIVVSEDTYKIQPYNTEDSRPLDYILTAENCTVQLKGIGGLTYNATILGGISDFGNYTITVTPNANYDLTTFVVNGVTYTDTNIATISITESNCVNIVVQAVCETEPIIPNNPTPVGDNATITITDSEGNIFDFSSDNFIVGKSYIVSATANEGYNNPTLEVNGVEQSIPYTFTVADTTPIVINSSATINTYTLTKTSENATITITNSVGEEVDSLTHGETYTVSVVANAGCNIDLLTLNGIPIVNGTTFTGGETYFENDVEIVAISTLPTFDITMNKTNASIAVNDNGMYYYFTTADCLTYGHSITIASEGNTGYTLNTFTVTMGGVSQTTSITNGLGTCTIALVTGDIEIFAQSVEEQQPEPILNITNEWGSQIVFLGYTGPLEYLDTQIYDYLTALSNPNGYIVEYGVDSITSTTECYLCILGEFGYDYFVTLNNSQVLLSYYYYYPNISYFACCRTASSLMLTDYNVMSIDQTPSTCNLTFLNHPSEDYYDVYDLMALDAMFQVKLFENGVEVVPSNNYYSVSFNSQLTVQVIDPNNIIGTMQCPIFDLVIDENGFVKFAIDKPIEFTVMAEYDGFINTVYAIKLFFAVI